MYSSEDIAKNSTIFPAAEYSEKDSFNVNGAPIIKVVGVGGGGNNAVNHMYKQGISGVSFVVANTDRQALGYSDVPTTLLIGPGVTKGLGAGNQPERAREAAEESAAEIAALFDEDTKMVFITAGMGGGTGTGASPVVARIARERGMLTVGIVTIPFMFEGEKKILKALDGANEMSKYVDALLVINNERLTEMYTDLTLDNAFEMADETLTDAARSISEMINVNGKINLDFEDIKTTLKDSGTAIISTGYGEGENRVTKSIQDALNSPLLKNHDIKTSKRFLFNLYYPTEGENPVRMGEMNEITSFMTSVISDVDVIWGKTVDNSLGSKVKITVLASGFDISLGNDIKFQNPKRKKFMGKKEEEQPETNAMRLQDAYGAEKVAEISREKARANYILLTPEQMDNDLLINFIERTPTYKRGSDMKFREEWRALTASLAESSATVPERQDEAESGTVIDFG